MADHPDQAPQDQDDVEAHKFGDGREEEAPLEAPTAAEPHADDVEGHARRRSAPADDPEARR